MKRWLAVAICALAAPLGHAQTAAPGTRIVSLPQANPQIHPAVARIVAPGNGSVSYGSGTLVYTNEQYGLVVTNWHVINEATGQISVHFADGFYSLGTVQRVDKDWDLALIAIRKPNAQPVPLATAAPQPGELLTIAGYGSGQYRAASGYCTQYVAPGTTFPFEMVEVAVSARQGDSGGPIFNSRGELAGVLFGEGNGRTSGSYCGRVRWFLTSVAPELGSSAVQVAAAKPTVVEQRRQTATLVEPELPLVAVSAPPTSPPPVVQTMSGARPAPALPTAATQGDSPARQVSVPDVTPVASASPESISLGWHDIAGTSFADQAKTVLAIVGILAMLFHVLRWLGREPAKAE